MADDSVRLPGSSYDELKKIIIAYKHIGRDAQLTEVAKLVGMDNTNVSRNNGFLISIGVITAGKKKGPTDVGMRLGQALEFDVDDHVSEIWREICQDNDFLRNLVSSVRIRKGMELNALRAHAPILPDCQRAPVCSQVRAP